MIEENRQVPNGKSPVGIKFKIKGAKTQADLDRLQPFMAYQAERLAEASR